MTKDVKIFAETVEDEALDQIRELSEHPVSDGSKIRIMPDVHAGKGCTIGTTMTITDRVCPNLVGVDIGCGMYAVLLGDVKIDYQFLDSIIRSEIPSGTNIRTKKIASFDMLKKLRCPVADIERAELSIGTLGGGNHFIEIDEDSLGRPWLIIHTGSRHLGLEVANYYQQVAIKKLQMPPEGYIKSVVEQLKAEGKTQEIQKTVELIKKEHKAKAKQKDLAYLEGDDLNDYLHDMEIVQEFAAINREQIALQILLHLAISPVRHFHTIHNYIDTQNKILRKGAVSAETQKELVIPMNMRDGVLLCIGLGNEDWNCSAPHGAGRIMSRKKAKETISLEEYQLSMKDIFSTSVGEDTLDEAPFAYKSIDEIRKLIQPTCGCVDVLKPKYNFKASE